MGSIFFEITIVLCLTALIAIIFRLLRQPPMLAYILTGMLIGPFAFFHINNLEVLKNFSELGITLLLFLLGLELQLRDLRPVGKAIITAGTAQVFLTGALAFGASILLGFPLLSSFYISAALTFSSTIIVVKLLSDKKDLHSLYGKLSIGLLLVQDFFAILLLILLSGYKPVDNPLLILQSFALILCKTVIIFTVIVNLSRVVLPKLIHRIARSQETLFLFSIAWVFGISALLASPFIGFSIEIGGFLAGIALANSVENFQIAAKIRPLRDFFVTIFFVFLGIQMSFGNLGQIVIPALLLFLFVLLLKPVIIMFLTGLLGYRKRTSFFTGSALAQVSEFSLIIVVLGQKAGQIPESIVSLVTLVAILSFATSPYIITHANSTYRRIGKWLSFFELKGPSKEALQEEVEFADHILIIGGRRMAETILESLKSTKEQVVVVDFDPDTIKKLQDNGITTIFGDIVDPEIQERAGLAKARLVVSTLSDLEDNLLLIKVARRMNKQIKVVLLAYDIEEARILYRDGADYVVLPHLAGGRQIAHALKLGAEKKLEMLKKRDKAYLD
ncbi:MAG TPA: cation:proton antiporter [Candidatus Eisenbacteria bacterium]|nr:cation:proton antiporter [Candidatus Eisenbacteria bacterium]